jgi:hypothetical protein
MKHPRAPTSERHRPGPVRIPVWEIRPKTSNRGKCVDGPDLAALGESAGRRIILLPTFVRPLGAAERGRGEHRHQVLLGARRFHRAEPSGLTAVVTAL